MRSADQAAIGQRQADEHGVADTLLTLNYVR